MYPSQVMTRPMLLKLFIIHCGFSRFFLLKAHHCVHFIYCFFSLFVVRVLQKWQTQQWLLENIAVVLKYFIKNLKQLPRASERAGPVAMGVTAVPDPYQLKHFGEQALHLSRETQ